MFIQKIIFMETLIFSNVLYFTSNFRKLLFLQKIRGILFLLQIFLVGETTPGALKTTGGPSKQNYRGTLKKRINFCPNNLVKGLKISPLTSEKKNLLSTGLHTNNETSETTLRILFLFSIFVVPCSFILFTFLA